MKFPILPALFALSAGSAAIAQQQGTQAGESGFGDDTYHDWSEVDRDMDGTLNTTEAAQALPDLIIVDINNDGMVNRSEVEDAMPGIQWDSQQGQSQGQLSQSQSGQGQGSPGQSPQDQASTQGQGQQGQSSAQGGQAGADSPVNETDYLVIVTMLEERDRQDQAGISGETGQSPGATQDSPSQQDESSSSQEDV